MGTLTQGVGRYRSLALGFNLASLQDAQRLSDGSQRIAK